MVRVNTDEEDDVNMVWIRMKILSKGVRDALDEVLENFGVEIGVDKSASNHHVKAGRNLLKVGVHLNDPGEFSVDLINGSKFHSGRCNPRESEMSYANCLLRPFYGKALPMPFCRWLASLLGWAQDGHWPYWLAVAKYFDAWCVKYPLENGWVHWRSLPASGKLQYDVREHLPEIGNRSFVKRIGCTEVFALFTMGAYLHQPLFLHLFSLLDACSSCSELIGMMKKAFDWNVLFVSRDIYESAMKRGCKDDWIYDDDAIIDDVMWSHHEDDSYGYVGNDASCWTTFRLVLKDN
jgi:hypothetical protein